MATFVRQKRAFRVPVRCLSQAAVAEMLAAYGGSEPPATLVAAVFHQTEGNAFFVGEVLQHLSEEGRLFDESRAWKSGVSVAPLDVPEGVRIVVGRRLARMSETTQAVLTTAAVVGRQFELRLLEALCALDGERFLEAIEEAETARLITSEQSDRQLRAVFSHELIRSTLVSGLSLPRRQRLHASVAKTLETVYRSSLTAHAAAIAHHLYEAGPAADATETIRFSMLASDQAADTGALESGLVHLERALSVVPDDDTRTRATLLWKYGLAHRSLGQLMGAIADWETALRLIETHGDRGTMAALCQELAHSYAWTGQPLLGVTAARRGLAALGEEASPNRCRLLACLGWNLSMACDFEAADPIIREALAMAEAMQDAQVRGEALLLSSWHYYLCMRRREQADACRQAVELLRPGRDQSKIGEALGNFQMACIQIGRPADLALTEQETGTLADRLGRFDIQVHRYFSETLRDWLMEGDLDRLDVGLRKAQGVAGAWGWLAEACQSQALLWRGQLEAARDLAEVALGHEPVVSSHTGPGWGVLFLCDCMADRRDPALALLDARASGLPRTGRLNTLGSWCALFKVVEGLAVVGEHTRAASLYPLVLDALATGTVVAFDASHLLETLAGMAAAAGGQWDVAEGHYQVAVRLADQMPFVIEQAEARYWYARLRLARDLPEDRPQAAELLQSAVPLYRGTGMEWHASRAEALLDGMMPA
ncbi:MAG: ATP-binding protein, partial [Acidobacteriota bacterium]